MQKREYKPIEPKTHRPSKVLIFLGALTLFAFGTYNLNYRAMERYERQAEREITEIRADMEYYSSKIKKEGIPEDEIYKIDGEEIYIPKYLLSADSDIRERKDEIKFYRAARGSPLKTLRILSGIEKQYDPLRKQLTERIFNRGERKKLWTSCYRNTYKSPSM
jgi:hypothetical protein